MEKSIYLLLTVIISSLNSYAIEFKEANVLNNETETILIGNEKDSKITFTANKTTIMVKVQKIIDNQKLNIKISDVEIVKTLAENDLERVVYILYLHDKDFRNKIGYLLEIDNDNNLYLKLNAFVGVTCTSTGCQFGCAPAELVDPKSGNSVLTCSSCTNTCTKSASVGN